MILFIKEHIADPLLIHAELMTESDDRLKKTAEFIFAKYIEDTKEIMPSMLKQKLD